MMMEVEEFPPTKYEAKVEVMMVPVVMMPVATISVPLVMIVKPILTGHRSYKTKLLKIVLAKHNVRWPLLNS